MNSTCLTRKERHRCLGFSIVVTTIVLCTILVYASLKYTGHDYRRRPILADRLADEECISTCFTKDCILHANLLNKNMEPSFDQCEDFYSFSCAKFVKQFGKEDNFSNYDVFNKRIFSELKDLLDNLEADPESASGKMKIVYDSCMDTRSSELNAITSAMEFFRSLGVPNWPDLSPDFEFTKPKLSTVLGTLAAYGENAFIKISNRRVDGKDTYDAFIESDTFKDKRTVDIPNKEARTLKYFNLDFKELAKRVFKYFTPLVALKNRYGYCENGTDFYINCTQDVPPQWRILCEVVDSFVNVGNLSHMISKTDIFVSCSDVDFVEKFLNLTTEIPHSVLVDLIMLEFFMNHLDDLNFYFRLIRKDDRMPEIDPYADQVKLNHWEHCVQWTTKHMLLALGREYIKNILTEEVLIEIQDVIEECSKEMNDLIANQKWLTETEITRILTKLDKPVSTQLMLKFYLNETFVNNYYSRFHPTAGSFIKNVLERQRMRFVTHIAKERDPVNIYDFTPFMVNAFNRHDSVELGFGYLRFPAFILDQPRILNLVRIAVSFGHEMGHTIDDTFSEITTTNSSLKARLNIIERNNCIKNQYSNFTIESLGVNVNAHMTSDENHADAISVALIDKLLKKYNIDEISYSLPSLPYSTKELVYMIYTELTCEKASKEMDQRRHKIESHANERFRITGVMQNSKSFAKTFNCSEGSYMNPESKCSLLDLE